MRKILQKTLTSGMAAGTLLLLAAQNAGAELTNPVLRDDLGANAESAIQGSTFARYFIGLWSSMMAIGAIFVLVLIVWGAIEWISSEGEKGKLENARNRITQAIIGLVILVSSFVIIGFVSNLLFGESFSILDISIPNMLSN
jgi:hypothetical protein